MVGGHFVFVHGSASSDKLCVLLEPYKPPPCVLNKLDADDVNDNDVVDEAVFDDVIVAVAAALRL